MMKISFWPYRRLMAWRTRNMIRRAMTMSKDFHVDDTKPVVERITEELTSKALTTVADDAPSDMDAAEFLSLVEPIGDYMQLLIKRYYAMPYGVFLVLHYLLTPFDATITYRIRRKAGVSGTGSM